MTSYRFFSSLYRTFATRRRALFAAVLLALALAAFAFRSVRLREDAASLLPDDRSEVAEQFRLLQEAPFARKVVVNLRAAPGIDVTALLDAADRLTAALGPPSFRPAAGDESAGAGFLAWLAGALPDLATPGDLEAAASRATPEAVGESLRRIRAQRFSPEGWATGALVRVDPLELRTITLAKLRYLNAVPGARLQRGRLVSADGRSALVVADTDVPVTDSAGAERLVAAFQDAAARTLPEGVRAELVSGHRYTLANARAIKRDLVVVLGLSSAAVLAIYLGYLRSRWALFVFLVPASVLVLASGLLSAAYGQVFAATLGFGGVLLGIADEYAMHVYFGLRRGGAPPDEIVGAVARPVLAGALATLCSFGVMLLSSLPGQRQLAVYAMSGIALSLFVSLVVLPHLVRPAPAADVPAVGRRGRLRLPRRWVLGGWVALLAVLAVRLPDLKFNGDLAAVNLVPADLRAAERELRGTWGNLRGKALAVAEGTDLDAALAVNDRLFAHLAKKFSPGELVSLSPVLPAAATRLANRDRWAAFWGGGRRAAVARELRRQGAPLGFAPEAFAPFAAAVAEPGAEPAPPTGDVLAALRAAGLGEALDSLILRGGAGVRVLTLVPDEPAALALFDEPACPPGVRLVAPSRFGAEVGRAIFRDFVRYLVVTLALVVGLVVAVFRRLRRVLLALVPVAAGLLALFGGMGWLGLEFNLFNVVATILIIGLCVDYGIFMVCRVTDGADHDADRSVLVSGLTTLAGFGALVAAHHPAMHSIGVTVLLGIGAAIPSALFVIPALGERAGE